jgi:hypothetical protein
MGYRIYGERRFEAPNDFRRAVEGLIVAHMPEDLICSDRVVFREDLTYHRLPDSFELHSRRYRTTVRGFPDADLLGDLIAEGNRTAGEVHAAMAANGADILVMADRLHDLFAAGLLNEDPKLDGIGSRRSAENGAAAEAAD